VVTGAGVALIRERQLRLLLSSRNNTCNRDYHAKAPDGEQSPVLNVFTRDGGWLRHRSGDRADVRAPRRRWRARHVDSIWPI
jgi:hypothetical protein